MESPNKNIRDKNSISNEFNDANNIILFEPSYAKIQNLEDTQNNSNSTINSTINYNSQQNLNSNPEDHMHKNTENKFNPVRSKFYNKYDLYDKPLNTGKKIINFPPTYEIQENKYGFLLNNELKTYPITISGYISTKAKYNDSDNTIKDNESKYDESLGLFFCGTKINIKNGSIKKVCASNEFMCNNCMDLNKKRYEIKNNYLININGRVTKINKGSYHCFGHFLCGNQIEDCINKFSCKACKLIDEYNIY